MDTIHSRWRKPKGRPSKKRAAALKNIQRRWTSSKTIDSSIPEGVEGNTSKLTPSRSEIKIKSCSEYMNSNPTEVKENPEYTIVNNSIWNNLLKDVLCQNCHGKFLEVKIDRHFGYATKLHIVCNGCGITYYSTYSSSRGEDTRQFNVNKDMVKAFLNLGKGLAGLETFSMSLGIQCIDQKTFDRCVKQLASEGEDVKKKILEVARKVVRQEHKVLNYELDDASPLDIAVSYDATWQKRGHSSLYCVACIVDVLTGLIIDFTVLSKYCHECTLTAHDLGADSAEFSVWFEGHKTVCEKNYSGSSGAMEVHAAEILFSRSIEQCNMRYTVVLSDGDSKSFLHLSSLNIYGELNIEKHECLNHVAKRLGTGLRNKIKEWRAKGVCLGGKKKGSLTEQTIIKLQNYYRKAIKDNAPNVPKMKTAIYASLYHCVSTDEKPQHKKCPDDKSSWCFYNRAKALGVAVSSHTKMKTQLSESVVEKILPVYQRLACDELLKQCGGKTQNANESVHNSIWRFCPKEVFVSKKRLELAATSGVSQFNMGCFASESVKLNNEMSSPVVAIAQKKDTRRIKQSVKRSTTEYKNLRNKKKFSKATAQKKIVRKEGPTYSAGAF